MESAPAISPDGRWVAYHAASIAGTYVFVQPLRESAPAVRVSLDDGGAPIWLRDGRTLYYRTFRWIMAARIGPSGEPVAYDTLFAHPVNVRPSRSPSRMWDLLPDESGFVMLENPPVRTFTVYRGWLDRLLPR